MPKEKDDVLNEPDTRTNAEPVNPVTSDVIDKKEDESIDNVDGSSQTHNDDLSSNGSEENLDPRERIARKFAKEQRGYEHPETDDVTPDNDDQIKAQEDDEPPAPSDPEPDPEPEKVEIKVNGRVLQVDKEKVDAAGGVEFYQKQVAVNEGFKDLAAQRRQIEQEKQALEQEKLELQKSSNQTPPQSDESQNASQDLPVSGDQRQGNRAELVRKHREALLDGDDATADELMMQLLGETQAQPTTPPQPQIDETVVASKAVELLDERTAQRNLADAGNRVFEENPELLTDKNLFNRVDGLTNLVKAEHPDWNDYEVMTESVKWAKQLNGEAPAPAADPTPPANTKVAEKRALNTPRANTGRAKAPPPPRQQTNSEYVTALRKSRGLE